MTDSYATPELADLGSVVTKTATMTAGTHPDGGTLKFSPASTSGSTLETANETSQETT